AATKRHVAGPGDPYYYEEPPVPKPEIYVTSVPPEFRRVELFIAGTVPNRSLLPAPGYEDESGPNNRPTPSPSPVTETWQEGTEPPDDSTNSEPETRNPKPAARMVTVMICALTGMRATVNCPEKKAKTFKAGTEPKEFCTFHR